MDHPCSRIYHVPSEAIARIQHEASLQESKSSKLQSFAAYSWKLIAEDETKANKTCKMGILVRGRLFLNPNHFGNLLSIPYEESVSDLKETSLVDVTDIIHRFIAKAMNEEHFRSLIDWIEMHRPEAAITKVCCKLNETDGDSVLVSSAQGLPLGNMDFGWGEPAFGSYYFPWGGAAGYVATMPSVKKNGDWLIYAYIYRKHLVD